MKTIYRTKDGEEFEKELDALYHEKSLEKKSTVNPTQMLVFDLIKRSSFNGFDGEKTVNYLVKNKENWVGVMPKVEDYALRDIDGDSFHIDTIQILCKDEESARNLLPKMKKALNADEAGLEADRHDYQNKAQRIIWLWWD